MDSWYLLHTKPQSERQVAILLAQRGIQVFLPEIAHTNAKGTMRKKAFFPGYLFAFLKLNSVGQSLWMWTPGLRYIVKYGDQPVPVPDEVITLVKHKLSEMELSASSPKPQFELGEIVRIKHGPFEDLLAIFEGPTNPTNRVRVLLSTLNRAIRVRVELDALEKAPVQASSPAASRPRRTRGRGRRIL